MLTDIFAMVMDMLLLMFFMMILTPYKFKQTAFILVAGYVLISMIQEDFSSQILFYILPFYHHQLSYYTYGFYYTVCYALFLMMITYIKEKLSAC